MVSEFETLLPQFKEQALTEAEGDSRRIKVFSRTRYEITEAPSESEDSLTRRRRGSRRASPQQSTC